MLNKYLQNSQLQPDSSVFRHFSKDIHNKKEIRQLHLKIVVIFYYLAMSESFGK